MALITGFVCIWLIFFIIVPFPTLVVTAIVTIVGGILMSSGSGDMGGGRW